ncbi:MAG: hypothetical protein AAF357_18740 [Verrucomicrobiota bacterium]
MRPRSTIVYVTDQHDQPLALRREFGYASSNAKKKYNWHLDKEAKKAGRPGWLECEEEDEVAAAERMLDYLYDRKKDGRLEGVTELHFVHRVVELKKGEVVETDRKLARRVL